MTNTTKTGRTKPMFALLAKLWFDIGKNYRDKQVHTIYSDLGSSIHWPYASYTS